MNIPAVLSLAAKNNEDTQSLIGKDARLTYAAADHAALALAGRLQARGCLPGDRVLLAVETGATYPIGLCGILKAGGWVVPVNPADPLARRRWVIQDAGCRWAVTSDAGLDVGFSREQVLPVLHEESAVPPTVFREVILHPDTEAMVIYTSGTTGHPKGAVMTHRSLLMNALDVTKYLNLTPADTVLIFLPTAYSYALSQLLTAMLSSARIVFLPNMFHPAYLVQAIKEHGITGFGGVPTTFNLLCDQLERKHEDLTSLRFAMNAGGPLSASTITRLLRLLPNIQLFNCYGCTEIGPRATYLDPDEVTRRPGSIGKALPSVRLRLIQEDGTKAQPGQIGEIVLGGQTLMKEYFRNPGATAKFMTSDGFHTGDLATIDQEGFIYFKGRKDDVFRCGAAKVSPIEVEEVLLRHPDILEAVVMGVPDPVMGMVPKAILVPKASRSLDSSAIRRWCMDELPQHCVPKVIEVRDALEKSLSGKLLRARMV